MEQNLNRLYTIFHAGVAISLVLVLILGCSGKGGPVAPELEGASAAGTNPDSTELTSPDVQTGSLARPAEIPDKSYIDGEVLVVLHDSSEVSESILRDRPLRLAKTTRLSWGTIFRLEITDGTSVEEMVSLLKTDPGVRFAEPNYIAYPTESTYVPNDPMWEGSDDGNDPKDNVYDQWGHAKLAADVIWNEIKGSDEIIVAVSDTGIYRYHEDLEDNLWINEDEDPGNGIDDDENGWIDDWWGWDCYNSDNEPMDDSGSYHGTSCAGIIAAIQDNEVGCTGIAPQIRIMTLKSLGTYSGTNEAVAESIDYAAVNGADIVSMSLGGSAGSEIVETACNAAWDDGNGVLLVAAAGNGSSSGMLYPAAYDSVMAIGATVPFDNYNNPIDEVRIASGVNGYSWGSNYGPGLDVMGFGEKTVTTFGAHYASYRDGFEADLFSGTSCATPIVSGTLALLHSYFPGADSQWLWDRVVQTSDDLETLGFDTETGNGRVNALRAVYGSDRYSDLEDPMGFVPLDLPNSQAFDSIHDLPGNPFEDTEDLYKVHTGDVGALAVDLEIYTWGENLDLQVFSDPGMTDLVAESTVENHFDSSHEVLNIDVTAGQDLYIRIYSPAEGNSTTYSLTVRHLYDWLSVSGESIAPFFAGGGGTTIPFLKLTFEAGVEATLNELIVSKSGSLPNSSLDEIKLFRDNGNGVFDGSDLLIAQELFPGTNRAVLSGFSEDWTWVEPLVLFVGADILETQQDYLVSFSLENYKDVITSTGITAFYTDFPIGSDFITIGVDNDPPEWVTTTGAQTASGSYNAVRVGWNEAEDLLTPPVMYNIYYTDSLPFDIGSATQLPDVYPTLGGTTDYQYKIIGLPTDVEHHFVVRAEDQSGNEDGNLEIVSATPGSGGDPENPEIVAHYASYWPNQIATNDNYLLITDLIYGLAIVDISDPMNLEMIGNWNVASLSGLACDNDYAYCGSSSGFVVIDITDPENPSLADSDPLGMGSIAAVDGNWAYVTNDNDSTLIPVDVSNPNNVVAHTPLYIDGSGWPYTMAIGGDYFYYSQNWDVGYVIDRTDPANLSLGMEFGGYWLAGVFVEGDYLYTNEMIFNELKIYDLSTSPENPVLIGSCSDGPSGQGYDLVKVGDYIYESVLDYGIVVFDVSDPENPEHVGDVAVEDLTWLATDGVFIYAATMYAGLYVIL